MDERRDPQPGAGTRAPIAGEPATPKQARGDYDRHASRCAQCQDIDHERCADGERLWRAWSTACDQAYVRLAGETG